MSIKGPYEIVHYFVGLSTDTKPTETAVLGDRFFESDTRLWYIYDGTSWSMLNGTPSGGGGDFLVMQVFS